MGGQSRDNKKEKVIKTWDGNTRGDMERSVEKKRKGEQVKVGYKNAKTGRNKWVWNDHLKRKHRHKGNKHGQKKKIRKNKETSTEKGKAEEGKKEKTERGRKKKTEERRSWKKKEKIWCETEKNSIEKW